MSQVQQRSSIKWAFRSIVNLMQQKHLPRLVYGEMMQNQQKPIKLCDIQRMHGNEGFSLDMEISAESHLESKGLRSHLKGNDEDLKEPNEVSAVFSSQIREFTHHLEEHEAMLENTELFYEKLREFHKSSGRRLTVSVGDTALDLYILYKEVTSRGGLERVVKGRRWPEVASALNFSGRIPNPSFPIRKHYMDLLYHFEQVYFFKMQGEPAAPPGPLPGPSQAMKTSANQLCGDKYCSTVKRKRHSDPWLSSSVDPGAHVGNIVTGAIETRFDGGYLITVTVGLEKLNGLLYHVHECAVEQFAIIPGLMESVGSASQDEPVGLQIRVGPAKRKLNMGSEKEAMKNDPDAPRRIRTAFQFFFSEEGDRLKKMRPGLEGNIRKMVIDAWKRLSETDRLPYIEQSQRDRERYNREIATYRERQNPQISVAREQTQELGYRPCYLERSDDYYYVSLEPESGASEFQPLDKLSMDDLDHVYSVQWMTDADLRDSLYWGWDLPGSARPSLPSP